MSDEDLQALRERNDVRAAAARKAMGTKWLLHSANAPKRKKKLRRKICS